MKKLISLVALSLILTASLYSQMVQFDVKIKTDRDASGITADITVTVQKGQANYTYFLTTNDPVKGEVLMKSEKTRKKTHVFKGVRPGKYYLKIEDGTGFQSGKTITVNEN